MPRWRTRTVSPTHVRPFGDAALSFPARSAAEAAGLAAAIRSARLDGVSDVVSGAASVLVLYDPTAAEFGRLAGWVRAISATPTAPGRRIHEFDIAFDGPDLDEVGEMTGLGADGVRRSLLQANLRVSFLGFAPGFAYLSGLPAPLRSIPRRAAPRIAVPAGSLGIAGGQAAIYPRSTPGGWHVVGRTAVELFDPVRPPHALLEPGDIVRLREVEAVELPVPVVRARAVAHAGAGKGTFGVESAGLYTTYQDLGRPGLAHLGVPRSGAADRVSFRLANALLGNRADAACLEITGTGPTLLCRQGTHVAVVGPEAEVSVDAHPVGCGRVLPVDGGQHLRVGSTGASLRAYLAVRGGFEVPAELGSRSTDRLGGLGPEPLALGDELWTGPPSGSMADHLLPGAPGQQSPERPRRLRALAVGWGTEEPSQRDLFGQPYEVEELSDRVGIRLRPVGRRIRTSGVELPSSGTALGTVQVPPGGHPVVLLVDHATVGGYPVGAVVITADLPEIGRCRPGDSVELVEVDQEEAADALRSLERALESAVVGSYPLLAG